MIEHVYRRARLAQSVERVIVATDDERIRSVIEPLGEVVMTAREHESGTDRIGEVAESIDCEIVVNVQGDLPLLDPAMVDALVKVLRAQPEVGMATVAVRIRNSDELDDPSVVKVVRNLRGHALYFSRACIPHDRERPGELTGALHHVGLYAYRRETLLELANLDPTPLERTEKLEQLRALENGIGIAVVVCDGAPPIAVDTQSDVVAARQALARERDANR